MRLTEQENKQILKDLGAISEDTRTAKFYYHSVIDNISSTAQAKEKAMEYAEKKSLRLKAEFDPDFSISNLKRLGAKTIMKDVLYIEIQHRGSKDTKSRIATEQDKLTFNEQWRKFDGHKQEIPLCDRDNKEKRENVEHYSSGSEYSYEKANPKQDRRKEKEKGYTQSFDYQVQIG